jgi:hypothetical protein
LYPLRLSAVLVVLSSAICADNGPLVRELPLNRFPDSRQTGEDARGFYLMPAAIGDDYFDGTSSLERIRRHFRVARQSGAKYLRCTFSWNGIERERGRYDWAFWDALVNEAQKNGIELIPYVAYTPEWAARDSKDFWKHPPRDPRLYADFMHRIAERYRGRIRSWEIWNEPDNREYWTGGAAEFAALAKMAAVRIRAADPRAVLVLGGMANGPCAFFRRLMEVHHIDRYVDVIAAHAYPETWLNGPAEALFRQWIPEMSRMIAANRSGADLWLNEMGYADYRFRKNEASIYGTNVYYRYEHTRRYQARMLFKFCVMTLASGKVSLAGWYRIDDFGPSQERLGPDLVNFHLGVVDAQGKPKPALSAMALFNRLFDAPAVLVGTTPADSMSVVNVFRTKDNRAVVVGWLRGSEPDEVREKSGMLEDARSEAVGAGLPCAPAKALGYYDVEGRRSAKPEARLRGESLSGIRLRGDRVFVAEFACGAGSQPWPG